MTNIREDQVAELRTAASEAVSYAFRRILDDARRSDVIKAWSAMELDISFWRIRSAETGSQAWSKLRKNEVLFQTFMDVTFSFNAMLTMRYGVEGHAELVRQISMSSQSMQMGFADNKGEFMTLSDEVYTTAMRVDYDEVYGLYKTTPWLFMMVTFESIGFQVSPDMLERMAANAAAAAAALAEGKGKARA